MAFIIIYFICTYLL